MLPCHAHGSALACQSYIIAAAFLVPGVFLSCRGLKSAVLLRAGIRLHYPGFGWRQHCGQVLPQVPGPHHKQCFPLLQRSHHLWHHTDTPQPTRAPANPRGRPLDDQRPPRSCRAASRVDDLGGWPTNPPGMHLTTSPGAVA